MLIMKLASQALLAIIVIIFIQPNMGKSCRDMAQALRDCMIKQECMSTGERTLQECLHERKYADECHAYRVAYFECKRGQLDMRTRFRGPKGGSNKSQDKNSST
uniref:Uncharacterized protein AlNc14C2602G13266 n=1 Tax=Albugo laibachii Nc14 TaxID=890382 RepID=F0X2Y9_9STRA|nr:hypothetical protein PITG_00849 [Albugo laibachii Nc14]|eukprot:CCA28364.1 hypothetical protein PITG_00849 [Albugo laibachii Nc14]